MVGVDVVEVDHGAERVEQRRHRGLLHERRVVAGDLDRDAAAPSERRSRGIVATERTSTAISDQGTPSSRCARRSRSATCSVSARSVSKVATSTRPTPKSFAAGRGLRKAWNGGVDGSGGGQGGGDGAGRGQQVGAETAGDPQRDGVGRRPSACRKSSGKSRMPRTSAPRKP